MKVHARFRLIETARIRASVYKNHTYESTEALRVKMAPVHGEPFGVATPGGELTMVIANPEAALMFSDAPIDSEFDFIISKVQAEDEQPEHG